MSAEEVMRVISPEIKLGSRLKLVFLPGFGDKGYLPAEVIKAIECILSMKVKNQGIEIAHVDLVTLCAIRNAGFYGPDANREVEVGILEGFDQANLSQLSGGLEAIEVIS